MTDDKSSGRKISEPISKPFSRALQDAMRSSNPLTKALQDATRNSDPLTKALQDAIRRSNAPQDAMHISNKLQAEMAAVSSSSAALNLAKGFLSPPAHVAARNLSSSAKKIQSVSEIGLAVRSVRKSKSQTQQEFADLAGVGRRFLSELESGKQTLEIGKVLQVAAAAGIQLMLVSKSNE